VCKNEFCTPYALRYRPKCFIIISGDKIAEIHQKSRKKVYQVIRQTGSGYQENRAQEGKLKIKNGFLAEFTLERSEGLGMTEEIIED